MYYLSAGSVYHTYLNCVESLHRYRGIDITFDIQATFHEFVIYFRTKIYLPTSNGSFVTPIRPKAK